MALLSIAPPSAQPTEPLITALAEAFIATDANRHHDALLQIRQHGVSIADFVDHLAPAIARLLGDRWFADQLSFADVTIGTARLQAVVKSFAPSQQDQPALSSGAGARGVLLVVPRSEQHSFGAVVLANQLRRLGHETDVMVDGSPGRLAQWLSTRRYNMIGVSAAGPRTLASAKDLIDTIRKSVPKAVPIALGGAALEQCADAIARTGADFVAQDAETALHFGGLPIVRAQEKPAAGKLSDRLFHAGEGEEVIR